MRVRLVAMLCALGALFLPGIAPAFAQSYPTQASWDWHRVNQVRAYHGLRGLYDWSTLNSYAQEWADWMAVHDVLAHGMLPKALPGWLHLGQNVGDSNRSAADVEYGFEHDATHLANILGRQFTRIGVGVAYGHGRWWVVQDYWG